MGYEKDYHEHSVVVNKWQCSFPSFHVFVASAFSSSKQLVVLLSILVIIFQVKFGMSTSINK